MPAFKHSESDGECFPHRAAVEWNNGAVRELQRHPSSPGCIFKDIWSFVKPEYQNMAPTKIYELNLSLALERCLFGFLRKYLVNKKFCLNSLDSSQTHNLWIPQGFASINLWPRPKIPGWRKRRLLWPLILELHVWNMAATALGIVPTLTWLARHVCRGAPWVARKGLRLQTSNISLLGFRWDGSTKNTSRIWRKFLINLLLGRGKHFATIYIEH